MMGAGGTKLSCSQTVGEARRQDFQTMFQCHVPDTMQCDFLTEGGLRSETKVCAATFHSG
jgi:hypothetical protein